MKGVLFNVLSELDERVMWDGMRGRVFGPVLKIPGEDNSRSDWTAAMVGTFADLATIEAGDSVFFFKDKMIYGVGEVLDTTGNPQRPLLYNFPDALEPAAVDAITGSRPEDDAETNNDSERKAQRMADEALYTGQSWSKIRILIPFRAAPAFFEQGIDMDYVLSSNGIPRSSYLEFFEGKNFSLLSKETTENLTHLIHMVNRDTSSGKVIDMAEPLIDFEIAVDGRDSDPVSIRQYVSDNPSRVLDDGLFSKENWVHATIIEALKSGADDILPESMTGRSRQQIYREFPTSPAKPTSWANHLDVLTEIQPQFDFPDSTPADDQATTVGYEVIEIKKDEIWYVDNLVDHLEQLMKYVDYVAEEIADGHYQAIDAYLLTGGYADTDETYREEVRQAFEERPTSPAEAEDRSTELPATYRMPVSSHRPFERDPQLWNNVTLLEYNWKEDEQRIEFRTVA
ncbi:hypothetical protein [Haloarcula laminariae]|uniref:hypothetical protein n=1 Tax=Haloarcula laminariae TaxID=2961577 RepID=UPI0021C809B1|nr:hypothetical protein [Halomicroarcula laminariae]